MLPLLPSLAVPELKLSVPLTPATPEFGVLKDNGPLDVCTPYPVSIVMAPPDPRSVDVASPALSKMSPPAVTSPCPTVTVMWPPFPFVDAPLPIDKLPLAPVLVVPELNTNVPLTPLSPAFKERSCTFPLDVNDPNPEYIAIDPPDRPLPAPAARVTVPPIPPVACFDSPARMDTNPPRLFCAVVSPEKIHMLPPFPVEPSPTVIEIDPPFPTVDAPDPNDTLPLFPLLDAPELKLREPLTPPSPAFTVRTHKFPLEVALPCPVNNETSPPEDPLPAPPDIITSPPLLAVVPLASPPRIFMVPPTIPSAVVSPAVIFTAPPLALFPWPTATVIEPPLPPVAAPVPTEIDPVLPSLEVPELKLSRPLTPEVPALLVLNLTFPLEVADP